ncbi:hypothetical protein ACHAWO_000442 [Cyclotella atomus]|uniref:PH domain-containing protein n=1 Tax=Cyclotella atomus TaxID=382360 RepID=A0ABD3QFY8_9STRA
MTGNNNSDNDPGFEVEAVSRPDTFLQLIQHLEHLIVDIPTKEATLALVNSNEDQLKSWYNAMLEVLKRCEVIVAGTFMSLLSSHLSADASREAAAKLMDQVQTALACCFQLMSDHSEAVEPTLHDRVKTVFTSSTGAMQEEYESIVDNKTKTERARGRLCRLGIYPRNHLEDSIRKMIHNLATFCEAHHEESVSQLIQDHFRRRIVMEGTELPFPCRTPKHIVVRLEQMRLAGVMPSERETRALTLENVEGLKQWFYAMEDVVAEFDMLTKLLRLKFEQNYESASLEWIDELVTAIREIVASNEVWASIHEDAIYPQMMDSVSKVLHTIPEDGSDVRVETYEYDRVIKDENVVQSGLAILLHMPLASHRRLRGALRVVSQMIAEFHRDHVDLHPSQRRRLEPGADGQVNINVYAMYD